MDTDLEKQRRIYEGALDNADKRAEFAKAESAKMWEIQKDLEEKVDCLNQQLFMRDKKEEVGVRMYTELRKALWNIANYDGDFVTANQTIRNIHIMAEAALNEAVTLIEE